MMRMMKMVLSVFTLMMIAGCWSVPHDWFGEIHHIPPPEPFIYMEYHYPADGEREVWYADSGVFQTYRLKDGVIKDCRAGSSGEGFYEAVNAMELFARMTNTTAMGSSPRLISVKIAWRACDRIMLQWSGAVGQVPPKITEFFFTNEAHDHTRDEAHEPNQGVFPRTFYLRVIPDPGREEDKDILVFEAGQYISPHAHVLGFEHYLYKLIPMDAEKPSLTIYEATPSFPRRVVQKPYTPGDKFKAIFDGNTYLIETFPMDMGELRATGQQR